MTDLETLLERSVDHHVEVDVAADVRRGRSALRRRRLSVGAGAAVVLLVIGGATTRLVPSSLRSAQPAHTATATVPAGAFEIPPPPPGWSVWQATDSDVVIAPDGTPPPDPEVGARVMGKLAISFLDGSLESPASGPTIEYDGRTFYDNETGGPATQVGVRVSHSTWLVLQEAPTLHWTVQQMIEYLDGVVVTPRAIPMS
jgi:hypothetical protein